MSRKNKKSYLTIALSVIMAFVICLVTMGSVPATTYTAYIDPALKAVLKTASSMDLIPVDIWLYDIDIDAVDANVKAETGLSKASLANEKTAAELTHAQVDAYIETERALYAEVQTEQSEAFLDKYSEIFLSETSAESNLLFVSKYAPVIQAELTLIQLATIVKDLSVAAIYYMPILEEIPDSNINFPVSGASYLRDNLGLTGTGVKIGILEAEGLPKRGQYNIPTNKIVFDTNVDRTVLDDHATNVAAIIMGQASGIYEGIVPDAMVYATYTDSNSGVDWRDCTEWLISKGVNVINMSMSYYGYGGAYNSLDRWADHVALQHRVHIVKSAGNIRNDKNPDGHIGAPGLAYNVITVGNLNVKETSNLSDDVISTTSAYVENSHSKTPCKPDIVAPGDGTTTPAGTINETSAATPHVTGIVAQLCQADTYLKTNPAAVKAILCATTVTSQHSYCPTDSEYDKYGAGLISAQQAYTSVLNERYLSDIFPAGTSDYTYQDHTFTISSSKSRFRIALTWLNYRFIESQYVHSETYPDAEPDMPDLDIRIYNSSGTQIIGNSVEQRGNVEIIDIDNLSAGTYIIRVTAFTGSTKAINYSLAWWY